ncbi:hypothetical protein EDD11_005134 [Mortierella claussenii]|nr:hypothetical protein EDD11_005134 [Mortierella claussenii]
MASSSALFSPPRRSFSLTEDDEAMAHHDSIVLPMSPPLSQESFTASESYSFFEPSRKQHQQQPHHSIHPLDRSSPTTPKKTLNWVNALPSHFDTASSGHPRKRRRRTNREELQILEDAFAKNLLPDAATRQELGDRLGMSVRAVQIWFQNRRQTLRKKSVSSGSAVAIGGAQQHQHHHYHHHHQQQQLQQMEYEEDIMSRSDLDSGDSMNRRSSGDSAMSVSPRLDPITPEIGGVQSGLGLRRTSRSCSNLLLSSPLSLPPSVSGLDSQLLRSETCSSLPTAVSSLLSVTTASTSLPRSTAASRSSYACPKPSAEPQIKQDPAPETAAVPPVTLIGSVATVPAASPPVVVVKEEVIESSPRELFAATTAVVGHARDIVDVKAADRHLCMLLEEAKRRSGQKMVTPVMALWRPETTSKVVLNASSSGTIPTTTTFPTPKRTMSTPSMRSSSFSQHHLRSSGKKVRKHRSMPEPVSASSFRACSPYPRTVSLMEQVIDRQQQQQQHQRPAPTNFRQSALSMAGKHTLDSVCSKAMRSTSPQVNNSSGLSAVQLARRLQYVVSSSLKRVQSESAIYEHTVSIAPPAVDHKDTLVRSASVNVGAMTVGIAARAAGARFGQTAMRARRLSFGKSLFDSDDTDEDENLVFRRMGAKSFSKMYRHHPADLLHQDFFMTHQAQKRRAGSAVSVESSITTATLSRHPSPTRNDNDDGHKDDVDGDETDEEDFVKMQRQRALKQANLSKRFTPVKTNGLNSSNIHSTSAVDFKRLHSLSQHVYKLPRKSLKSSLSTLSLATTSSPTRQYGIELERSHSPMAISSYSTMERNRTSSLGESTIMTESATNSTTTAMDVGPATTMTTENAATTAEKKDLDMDELECANVLAGLGWGR